MAAKQLKEKVRQVLQKYQHDKSALVDILQDIQAEIGYLPEEAWRRSATAWMSR